MGRERPASSGLHLLLMNYQDLKTFYSILLKAWMKLRECIEQKISLMVECMRISFRVRLSCYSVSSQGMRFLIFHLPLKKRFKGEMYLTGKS